MIFDINSPGDQRLIKTQSDSGLDVGFTSGCFDLFHYLHLIYLQKCRRQCEFLVVGIDSDRLVRETKGDKRPIIPEQQRAAMVAALECTDAVFIMDDLADFSKAAGLGINYIFKNGGFRRPSDSLQVNPGVEIVGVRTGTEVVIVPDVNMPDSTSCIIEDIIARKQEESQAGATDPETGCGHSN